MFRLLSHVLVVGLALATAVAVSVPAAAITYGSPVAQPSRTVPWVLSLYYSSTADGAASFLCTASALSSREVLTAAHCVQGSGYYYVNVGADRLSGGWLDAAEAVVDHSKYSRRLFVNDLAVLRTLTPLRLRSYARLAPAALTRRATNGRAPLTLYGWGQKTRTVASHNSCWRHDSHRRTRRPTGCSARRSARRSCWPPADTTRATVRTRVPATATAADRW